VRSQGHCLARRVVWTRRIACCAAWSAGWRKPFADSADTERQADHVGRRLLEPVVFIVPNLGERLPSLVGLEEDLDQPVRRRWRLGWKDIPDPAEPFEAWDSIATPVSTPRSSVHPAPQPRRGESRR